MRERLVVTLVGMTLAVIALFGIPRAYWVVDLITDDVQGTLDRTTELMGAAIDARTVAGGTVDADYLERLVADDERVTLERPDGTSFVVGPAVGDDALWSSRTLESGGEVTVAQPRETLSARISDALTPLVLLGLLVAAVAAVVGFVLARRLAYPFRRLADTARELGTGRFDVDVPHSLVPEAEALGDALRQTAGQLDLLVRRERLFAVSASHELRTPVTSLRLVLEDLSLWPQTPPDVAEELTRAMSQLDRLEGVIGEMLDDRRGTHLGEPIDIDLVVLASGIVDRFRPRVREAGRSVLLVGDDEVPARLVPGPVAQVVEAMLDNALAHGAGHITVSVTAQPAYLQVAVADEGERTAAPGVIHQVRGMGGGLSAISVLTESMGGQLLVDDAPTTAYVLRLPRGTTDALPA